MNKNEFCKMTAVWNADDYDNDLATVCDEYQVVETREELADFVTNNGEPKKYKTPVGELYVWEDVQQSKGLRRGELFVADAGDKRFCYFSGEVK